MKKQRKHAGCEGHCSERELLGQAAPTPTGQLPGCQALPRRFSGADPQAFVLFATCLLLRWWGSDPYNTDFPPVHVGKFPPIQAVGRVGE